MQLLALFNREKLTYVNSKKVAQKVLLYFLRGG